MPTKPLPPRVDDGDDFRVPLPIATSRPDDQDLEDFPIEETAVDRVFSVLENARGAERATVKLYRIGKPGVLSWCDDYSIEEFESGGFAMIREKWGAGEYEIRLYAIRPTDGRFGVMAKPRITIEPSNDPAKNPVVPAAPAVDPALREMMAQMAANQNAMLQALTQRPDPMANMQQMLTLAASFKQAFGGSDSGGKSSISEIVQAVRELRSVSEEINPPKGDDSPDSPWKMLPGVLDLVGKFAPQFQNQQTPALPAPDTPFPSVALPQSFEATPAPQENPAPVSLPVAAPSTDIPTDEEMNALQLVLMRGYLAKLCQMSASGNVENAAQFALDKLPDEAVEVLENPAWFEALTGFYPAAAQHRPWLTLVRDRVIQLINAPD